MWTDQLDAVLKQHRKDGLSFRKTATAMGLSVGAVSGRLDRMQRGDQPRQYEKPKQPPRQRLPGQPLPRTTPFRMPRQMNPGGDQRLNKLTAAPNVGPEIVDLPPDHGDAPVTLIDAGMDQCRWPLGDPGADMLVCGGATGGGSWCPRHCRLAYRPRAA